MGGDGDYSVTRFYSDRSPHASMGVVVPHEVYVRACDTLREFIHTSYSPDLSVNPCYLSKRTLTSGGELVGTSHMFYLGGGVVEFDNDAVTLVHDSRDGLDGLASFLGLSSERVSLE